MAKRKKSAVPRGNKAPPQGGKALGEVSVAEPEGEGKHHAKAGSGEVSAGISPAVAAGVGAPRVETPSQSENRWRREGRDLEVAAFRSRERERLRQEGMSRRSAHDEAWRRAVERFPPPGVEPASPPPPEPPPAPAPEVPAGVQGLADLPADWPALSPNAGLQAEVAWVQANRLRCVQGNTVVLAQALGPAPSHAALSWLETSILYPSKWADVAVRATQHTEDEQAMVKRERKSIAELEAILKEMAPRCPHCGELLC